MASSSKRRAAAGSALFFILAPGFVAGLFPWAITQWHATAMPPPLRALGWALLALGAPVLVSAFVRFVTEGLGTPAPVAPTSELVVGGLYRFVRNPMYVAVGSVIAGQALILGSAPLAAYLVVFALALAVASFVRGYEEPTLRETYGASYERYCQQVPAWIPRLRPAPKRG